MVLSPLYVYSDSADSQVCMDVLILTSPVYIVVLCVSTSEGVRLYMSGFHTVF